MDISSVLIIVGLSLTVFGAGFTALAYYLGFRRPKYRREHITHHTTGRVVRMSYLVSSNVRVPLVEYEVEGARYTISGPRFSGYSPFPSSGALGPNRSNIPLQGPLPLVVHSAGNSLSAQRDMAARYPAGRLVDVFYDPDKPECAFVERDAPIPSWAAAILLAGPLFILITGIALLLAGLFIG